MEEKKFWDLYHLYSLNLFLNSQKLCWDSSLSFRLLNWDVQRHIKPWVSSLLGESRERISPRKSLYLRVKGIVRKEQQTRLLVEDNNSREMFLYYCISDEFHNSTNFFFRSLCNYLIFALQFLLKMDKCIETHF